MDQEKILTIVITSLLTGGGVFACGLAALKWHLRTDYVPRSEVNGIGSRVDKTEADIATLAGTVAAVERRAGDVELEQKAQWSRIAEHVIAPLKEMTSELRGMRDTLVRHDEKLGAAVDRMDRLEAPATRPRRRGTGGGA